MFRLGERCSSPTTRGPCRSTDRCCTRRSAASVPTCPRRGGFVKLALRTERPILPVAIMGAEETLPLLGKLPGGALGVPYLPVTGPLPLPAKWRIRIGEPLAVPAGARETDSSVV